MISKGSVVELYLKNKFKNNECSWLLYEHFILNCCIIGFNSAQLGNNLPVEYPGQASVYLI